MKYEKTNYLMLAGCFAVLTLAMWRCTTPPVEVVHEVIPEIPQGKCVTKEWCNEWDKYFPYQDFDVSGIKIPFCSGDKKKIFRAWAQSIAYAESNYNWNETYKESFLDSTTGEPAISAGVFQLSKSDAIYYKKYEECAKLDLFNPYSNASCAGRIMQHLLTQVPDIETLGRYWAVARSTNKRYAVTMKKFQELMPNCK